MKEEQSFTFVDKRRRTDDEEKAATQQPAASTPTPAPEPEHADTAKAPAINFPTFIYSLVSSAAYHMGEYQDPYSGKTSVNLELAKQTIDIIAMLSEKTKGNLTPEESKLITHALYDLRMRYVELTSKAK